jgi:hypothetical protein
LDLLLLRASPLDFGVCGGYLSMIMARHPLFVRIKP